MTVAKKCRFILRKPPFYPLNYGNNDIVDFRFLISDCKLPCASKHQRNKLAAAGDFELAEDCVEMLFHHRQTQASAISDLLVAPSFTNKSGNFLFAPGESDKMRQTRARRRGMRTSLTAQIFALDKKMGLRHAA